jgi:hypothetical protein
VDGFGCEATIFVAETRRVILYFLQLGSSVPQLLVYYMFFAEAIVIQKIFSNS